ncbi:MAG TPA: CbiX/SirB N-terminal domain-containing protein [Candidatus Kapabacteria bacterium]|nr:CbiX/SirB N-terminal domain-containing protein [Candidatus Kapabacteria bacterium]
MKKLLVLFLTSLLFISCSKDSDKSNDTRVNNRKVGILLVSHGSRSEAWRKMLNAVEDSVRDEVLSNPSITQIKSAFMEYTEPSIATRMKEFDKEGFTDVIIVPLFLTVSGHSFDDIPTIVGLKTSSSAIEELKAERIEVYKAKANIKITPLLDFTEILKKNIVNRVKEISQNPSNESCVLVAYGDHEYNKEWTNLMKNLMTEVESKIGINKFAYSWCGHIANYDPQLTTNAINESLQGKDKAIVVPVLVAYDEMFQGRIINDAIDRVKQHDQRVIYRPDAILPDKNIDKWVIDIVNQYVSDLAKSK